MNCLFQIISFLTLQFACSTITYSLVAQQTHFTESFWDYNYNLNNSTMVKFEQLPRFLSRVLVNWFKAGGTFNRCLRILLFL
ncbi:hypothetical protein Hanom_Chr02g00123231 [Helianthus anomalus]